MLWLRLNNGCFDGEKKERIALEKQMVKSFHDTSRNICSLFSNWRQTKTVGISKIRALLNEVLLNAVM